MKSNAEIFRAAAECIRTGGLYQRGHAGGGNCTWTAIHTAAYAAAHPDALSLGRLAAFRATGDTAMNGLYNWNDNIVHSPEEVIALLEGLAFDEELTAAAKMPSKSAQKLDAVQEAVSVG